MKRNRFTIVFLTIITFGLIWIKWNKQTQKQKNTIYQIDKLPFNISELISIFEKDNIEKTEVKLNRLTVFVKEIKKVKLDSLKTLNGVKGVFAKSNSVSIIFGEYTEAINNALIKTL
ncbi:PTS sugar transporter subunit IIABC [Mycoplasma sp. Pen4]|uniref:PTS sugar transporter subunit IIABC n=1 Tax=Mycoplasma sp. Pen4 TaxID=640330 RepID=UPI002104F05B|nr:PTS sugar transporter subunit IIABC [Mycoplasma sp. Pen4]